MKLFFAYLKLHVKSLLMFFMFSLIFVSVFFLYDYPAEPVLYAAGICLLIGAAITLISFIRFRLKHRLLDRLKSSITIDIKDLPEPSNKIEADYQKLISELFQFKCAVESRTASEIADMIDYYTLWAHQIKTPISAMRLLLQTDAASGEMNLELTEQLFRIEQYVEMVLQYLRCESLSGDYVIRDVMLDTVVKSAVRKYSASFIRRRLSLEYSELCACVLTDEKWLSFVIEQLLSNALKYTKSGRISIYMAKDQADTLVIEDTGIGIQPEDLPRVFERGYTGYNGRSDKKSTGIGLYLCRTVCDKLSHTLRIESTLGVGTKVFIGFSEAEITEE